MNTQKTVEQVTIATSLTYEALVAAFERTLARLDPSVNLGLVQRQASWTEVEQTLGEIAGDAGLMIIFRANQGAITSLSGTKKRCSLYLVGNPVIAEKILSIDIRASFYVPFRVCLSEDGDSGATIAYDLPSSALASLGRRELDAFGVMLDEKIGAAVHRIIS